MDRAFFEGYLQARTQSTNSASEQPSRREQVILGDLYQYIT